MCLVRGVVFLVCTAETAWIVSIEPSAGKPSFRPIVIINVCLGVFLVSGARYELM